MCLHTVSRSINLKKKKIIGAKIPWLCTVDFADSGISNFVIEYICTVLAHSLRATKECFKQKSKGSKTS